MFEDSLSSENYCPSLISFAEAKPIKEVNVDSHQVWYLKFLEKYIKMFETGHFIQTKSAFFKEKHNILVETTMRLEKEIELLREDIEKVENQKRFLENEIEKNSQTEKNFQNLVEQMGKKGKELLHQHVSLIKTQKKLESQLFNLETDQNVLDEILSQSQFKIVENDVSTDELLGEISFSEIDVPLYVETMLNMKELEVQVESERQKQFYLNEALCRINNEIVDQKSLYQKNVENEILELKSQLNFYLTTIKENINTILKENSLLAQDIYQLKKGEFGSSNFDHFLKEIQKIEKQMVESNLMKNELEVSNLTLKKSITAFELKLLEKVDTETQNEIISLREDLRKSKLLNISLQKENQFIKHDIFLIGFQSKKKTKVPETKLIEDDTRFHLNILSKKMRELALKYKMKSEAINAEANVLKHQLDYSIRQMKKKTDTIKSQKEKSFKRTDQLLEEIRQINQEISRFQGLQSSMLDLACLDETPVNIEISY